MQARIEAGVVHSPYPYNPRAHDASAYGLLWDKLASHGSKTALICGDEKLTYGELREKVLHSAAKFRRQGIGKGDRLYVHIGNSIDSFVAVCSVPLTGASLVSSDIMWREDDIVDKIEKSNATHVLTDVIYAEMFARITNRCKIKKTFLVGERRSGLDSGLGLCNNNESHCEIDIFDTGDGKLVTWTTAPDGASKDLEIPLDRFLAQTTSLVDAQMLTSDDAFLGDINISFLLILSFWILALHQGSVILISRTCHAVPFDVFDAVKDFKEVTIVSFASRMKQILNFIKTSDNSDIQLKKSLRRIILFGSSTPPELAKELASTFQLKDLRSWYGMNEAGGFLTVPPNGDVSGIDVGFPVPGVRMKIIDSISGKILGPMQRGEVHFYTPYAASGYSGHSQDTIDIMDEQGWIHTGDLGYYDHDGRLFLCGRLKEMMVCQSRKVNPAEIECCLMEHAAVEEVAVVGIPCPDGEEFPAAMVVTKHGYSQNQDLANDLKRYVAERTASFMHLRGGVYFTDALPKSTRGKDRANMLRERLATLPRLDNAEESEASECVY
nr:luciferin 4-monooxygenase-like [Rhipicephalus microplus]